MEFFGISNQSSFRESEVRKCRTLRQSLLLSHHHPTQCGHSVHDKLLLFCSQNMNVLRNFSWLKSWLYHTSDNLESSHRNLTGQLSTGLHWRYSLTTHRILSFKSFDVNISSITRISSAALLSSQIRTNFTFFASNNQTRGRAGAPAENQNWNKWCEQPSLAGICPVADQTRPLVGYLTGKVVWQKKGLVCWLVWRLQIEGVLGCFVSQVGLSTGLVSWLGWWSARRWTSNWCWWLLCWQRTESDWRTRGGGGRSHSSSHHRCQPRLEGDACQMNTFLFAAFARGLFSFISNSDISFLAYWLFPVSSHFKSFIRFL